MPRHPMLAAAALGLALLSAPAAAQTAGEVLAQGRALAESWCANCHVTGDAPGRSGSDAAPTFATIARQNPDPATLRTWLGQRHKAMMPNYNLSRDEVDGVITYILSLRR